jgi:hypothetical protein
MKNIKKNITSKSLSKSLMPNTSALAIHHNKTGDYHGSNFLMLISKIITICLLGVLLLPACKKEDDILPSTSNATVNDNYLKAGLPTYYVSPNGNNSANGDITHPWKTLFYASTRVKTPGNIIHLMAGSYSEANICYIANGVSLVGEGKDKTIIHCSKPDNYTVSFYSSTVENGNHEISNIGFVGDMVGFGGIGVVRQSNTIIHDCSFTNFKTTGVYFGNSIPANTNASGSKIFNSTFTNCSAYSAGGSIGALNIIGQTGFSCYNNTITLPKRGTIPAGFGIKTNYTKGMQIYNNIISIDDNDDNKIWAFAMELWNTSDGCDIYSNTFRGIINFAGDYTKKGNSSYSIRFRNNVVGHTILQSVARLGIILETRSGESSDVYMYDNIFKNLQASISFNTLSTSVFKNIYIYRNSFNGIGISSNTYWGNVINSNGSAGFTMSNIYIWNNTMVSGRGTNSLSAIQIPSIGKVSNVEVKNNIVTDFGKTYITSGTGTSGTISSLFLQSNDIYNCGTSNEPSWGGKTPTNITKTNILKVNPLFVSQTDFHLRTGSPAINPGINVGLPYNGTAPDLGAFESTVGM